MAAHPILILCSFAAFVDRTNVSFASLTMNKTLGFSSAVYGLGAGIFFWGYCLFEIPSNLILAKVGARLWIARILITWGIISGVTGFVWSPTSFYTMRFLLGLRSGLLSGDHPLSHLVVPETLSGTRDRAVHDRDCRIGDTGIDHFRSAASARWGVRLARLSMAVPDRSPAGNHPWLHFYFALTNTPADAHWLNPDEQIWLIRRLQAERRQQDSIRSFKLGQALSHPRMWLFTLVYFGQTFTGYGLGLFMPQIITRLGVGLKLIGWVTAIPSMFGLVAMLLSARYADRSRNLVMTVALPASSHSAALPCAP